MAVVWQVGLSCSGAMSGKVSFVVLSDARETTGSNGQGLSSVVDGCGRLSKGGSPSSGVVGVGSEAETAKPRS